MNNDDNSSNHQDKRPFHARLMGETDQKFHQALATLISNYEKETGNTVSANFAVKQASVPGSYAPLTYCRDVRLTDEDGVERPRPFIGALLDISADLSIFPADSIDSSIYHAGAAQQIHEYADSTAGPFVVKDGRAVYKKDAMEKAMSSLPDGVAGMLQALAAALSQGLSDLDGEDHGDGPLH